MCVLHDRLADEKTINSVLKQSISSYEELVEPLCHVLEKNLEIGKLHENQLFKGKFFYENKLIILATQIKSLSCHQNNLSTVNEPNEKNRFNKENVSETASFLNVELENTAKILEGFLNSLTVSENLHKDQLLAFEQLPAIKEQSLLSEDELSENKAVLQAKNQLVNVYKKLSAALQTGELLKNDFNTLLNSTYELTKDLIVLIKQLSEDESVHNLLNISSSINKDKFSPSSKLYMASSNTVELEKDICWVSEVDSTCDRDVPSQANHKPNASSDFEKNTCSQQNITESLTFKISQEQSRTGVEDELQMFAVTTSSSTIPVSLTNSDYNREINFTHEELIVEYLKVQSLLAGKDEIEIALENHIKDLEMTLSETKQKLAHVILDNSQLMKLKENLHCIHRCLEKKGLKLEHATGDTQDLYGKSKHINKEADNDKPSYLIESENSVDKKELLSSYLQIQLLLLGENVTKSLPIYLQELESLLNDESENVNKESIHMISKNLFDERITEKPCDLVPENKLLQEDLEKLQNEKKGKEPQGKQIIQFQNDIDKLSKEFVNNKVPDFNVNVSNKIIENSFYETSVDSTGSIVDRSDNIGQCERSDGLIDSTLNKLLEKCSVLNKNNNILANRCEDLKVKVCELEMKNKILDEELLKYIKTDSLNTGVERTSEENNIFHINCEVEDLKLQLKLLENENTHLKLSEENLRSNLKGKLETFDGMLKSAGEQNSTNCSKQLQLDDLILEISNKSKEIVFLHEKAKCQENIQNNLITKINFQEEIITDMKQKVMTLNNELSNVHSKFQETCQAYQEKMEELNIRQRELKILKVEKEQLELCKQNLLECNDFYNSAMQQETKKIINDFANEVICLQKELQRENNKGFENDHEQGRDLNVSNRNHDFDVNRFEVILKSNEELLAEKELLLDKLHKQQQLVEQIQVCHM